MKGIIAKLRRFSEVSRFLLTAVVLGLVAVSAPAADEHWLGVPGVTATINWSDVNNWTSPQNTFYNQVQFDGTGAGSNTAFSVNNILDAAGGAAQMPIWELDYTPVNSNYTTLIDPGVTLSLNAGRGFLFVGADELNTANPAASNAVETITITGAGGTLSMVGNLSVAQGSAAPGDAHNVTLDLSGLDNFIDNGPGGGENNELLVASGGAARTHGTLYLAKTNQITLGNDFLVCNQTYSNSLPCAVYLGQSNSILLGSGNLTIAGTGTTAVGAWMKFNPVFLGGSNAPIAFLGGTGSDGRIVNFWIGNANGGPQVSGYGLCDFSGGSVAVFARTMQLGQGGNAGASALGVLTLDDGVVNVNNAMIGNQEVSGGGAGAGVVNLNQNATYATNGTLIVNNTLILGATTGTLTAGSAGTINVNGGTLVANIIVEGGGAASINLTNGSLTVTGVAGSSAAPLNRLVAVNSSLTLAVENATTNVVVANLGIGGTTNIINIASVPVAPSYPVVVTLVKYSGSIQGGGFNFGVGTLPPLCAGYVSNDVTHSSIDLVLTSGPLTEMWTGAANGNWNTTTMNWNAGTPVTYSDGDFVQFLDGAATGTINLPNTVAPGGITVSNNSLLYSFVGSGAMSGSTSLLKEGAGALVLDNSGVNNFTGGIVIGGGSLQVGNDDASGNLPSGSISNDGTLIFDRTDNNNYSGAISGLGALTQEGAGSILTLSGDNTFAGQVLVTNGSVLQLGGSSALGAGSGEVIIANGSTFDANGYSATKTLVVSGAGVNGNGALTDSGESIYNNPGPGLATNIILTGDTTFNYPTRWDLGSVNGGSVLGTDGNPHNLTLNGNSYFEWRNLAVLAPVANITIATGTLGVAGSTSFGASNATLAIYPAAGLTFYGPSVTVNKNVDFQNGATINNGSGATVMNGTMTLEAGSETVIVGGGTMLTINDVMIGSGIFSQVSGSGNTILNGNSPSFIGGIDLIQGQITLNGVIGSGLTNSIGSTLTGSGSVGGWADLSGTFYPGGVGAPGTFTAGGLTLESSCSLTMDLTPNLTSGNDLIAVNGDLVVGGNNININPISGILASGTYRLFNYTGKLTGTFGTASIATPSRYTLRIDTNTPHQVNLIVSGTPDLLAWNNGANDGQWDVDSSQNWTNLTAHTQDQFFAGDTVLLDDSIILAANPTTTLTIGSGVVVAPSVVTNNSTTNYTISGGGAIGGGASLVKLGSSTLTINTVNTFTGNVNIGAGAVQVNTSVQPSGSGLGATNGTVFITNGASLVLNLQGGYPAGDSGLGTKPIVVSGAGIGGNGAIQNNGNSIYDDSSTFGLGHNVTMVGDTTIGGTSRWDWGYPGLNSTLSTGGSNFNLTVIEPSYSQWNTLLIDTNLGNFDFYSTASSPQTWAVAGMGGSLGNPTNFLTLHSNVVMNIQHGSTATGDSGYAKVIHILPTAGLQFQPSGGAGDYRLAANFILENNSEMAFYSGNGGSGSGTVVEGTVTLNGLTHFSTGDSTVTFSNVIEGPGGFYWDTYNNTIAFAATNTYTGISDIRSGRVLALIGNGSISASTNVSLAAGATLDVSARADGKFTLASGQTLQGGGTINGSLVAGTGSIVSPGGFGAIGTLTVTNAVTLAGTTAMDLNKSAGTFDQINSGGTITFGGALLLTNISGTLAAGDSVQLFNSTLGMYAGLFASIQPVSPGPGLLWQTNQLNVSGVLSVIAGPSLNVGTVSFSSRSMLLFGSNGVPGGTFYLLATTNLALPLTNWVPMATNVFDNNGGFVLTNSVGTNLPQQFFELYMGQMPPN